MMLAKRKMTSLELANRVGMTPANLSILKTGKAKAVRMSTMDAICRGCNASRATCSSSCRTTTPGSDEKGAYYGRTDAAPVSCGKTGTDFLAFWCCFSARLRGTAFFTAVFVWDLPWGRWP